MRLNGGARYKAVAKRAHLPAIAITAAFALLLVVSGFFAWNYFNSNDDTENEEEISQRIIEKVNAVYITPEGEKPVVAQLKDKEKLQDKDNAFYSKAQNGDYVLVYSEAQVAIIYREDSNRLVAVSSINPRSEVIDRPEKQADVVW